MEKLFFAIYKDQQKVRQHRIVSRSTKKILETELRDEGLIPKAIFGQKDIDKIMKDEFMNMAIGDSELDYMKAHIEEWESAKQ